MLFSRECGMEFLWFPIGFFGGVKRAVGACESCERLRPFFETEGHDGCNGGYVTSQEICSPRFVGYLVALESGGRLHGPFQIARDRFVR